EGTSTLPERAVVITFDDGWASQYRYAFPILRQLGLTATFFIYSKPIGHDPLWMNWGQIRELQDAGMTIGSHSRTHPLLTDLRVSLQDEIDDSRADIKRMTGKLPAFFAYPYGAWDPRSMAQVEAAGYRAGRALPGGPWNSPTNRFALQSVLITDDMEVFERELGP
ncbi:MAG TPA: polysaccharide deacetylase family protein, partial [Gemmatimonadaceae bacterium]